MQISQIVFQQTLVMFLYMVIGAALYKSGRITRQGSREIAGMLLYLVLPAVILRSFCTERTAARLQELGVSSLLGAAALLLAMIAARILYKKFPIEQFAAAFSNAGFIGIPLTSAVLGEDAVLFLVGFVALLNILQWTYGVRIMTGKKSGAGWGAVLKNPILLAALAGLGIFLTGLGNQLPNVLSVALSGVSALNAPLAMMILGVYMAQTDIRSIIASPRLYGVCAVRLLLIPLLTAVLLCKMPFAPQEMKLAVLLGAAAPVGANVAVYAQLHGLDYADASRSVVLSTVLSIGTLPLVLQIALKLL